jgi:hypothetical protein
MAHPFAPIEGTTAAGPACIGCGCTEDNACFDEATYLPCTWIRLDTAEGKGVCSCRSELEAEWDAGDREFRIPIELDPSEIGRSIMAEGLMVPVADRARFGKAS